LKLLNISELFFYFRLLSVAWFKTVPQIFQKHSLLVLPDFPKFQKNKNYNKKQTFQEKKLYL